MYLMAHGLSKVETKSAKLADSVNILRSCLKARRKRRQLEDSSHRWPFRPFRPFRPFSVDTRQLGLVREEGQIVDTGNTTKRVVSFVNTRMVLQEVKS